MKILIHSNASWGGIVDYMIWQAEALCKAGHQISLIVPTNFDKTLSSNIQLHRLLPDLEDRSESSALVRRFRWISRTVTSWKITTRVAAETFPDSLLLSSYSEYLSPLWTHHFSRLRKSHPGLRIGAIVHDPVRLPIGPPLFHKFCVRRAYEILDVAFTHTPGKLDQAGAMPPIPTQMIPFGVYHFPDSLADPSEVRKNLSIPEDSILLLGFGHIRNSKNLDLAIKMLPKFPNVYLVIAGKVMSKREQPVSYYHKLASQEGVSDKVTILEKFLSEEEVADLFSAADFSLLSYNSGFVSASSVLHTSLKFRKLSLATSGKGHLKWAVEKYQLGVWVQPDSVDSLCFGMKQLLESDPEVLPQWEKYEKENTWERNAELVAATLVARN